MVAATLPKGAGEATTKPKAVAAAKAVSTTKADAARLNLLLPAKSIDRLDRLKEKTEAASYTEVIRNAIRLYEGIVAEYEKGNKVQVVDAEGKVTSLSLF